jgi:hypothetical protein
MNKIIYVVFFMVHMCIYYWSLHLYIKDTDVSYFKQSLSSDKPVTKPVTKPTLDDLYALMNTNYVKDILEPFSSERPRPPDPSQSKLLIPLDKIVKDDPNYYVIDDENNKRIINIYKSHIQLNRGGPYYENTFYIVGCIWEWEHVSIQSLPQHCLPYRRGIMEEGRGQDHRHSHYIIQDVIYPRYVFHTLHK